MVNIQEVLAEIIASLQSSYGEDFFHALNLQLSKHIGADYTMIARLNEEKYTAKSISLVAKGKVIDNFEYSLNNTPCAEVNADSLCIYPSGICALYPKDQLLIDMKIEGYIGTPLRDSHGNTLGLIVALHEQTIENKDFVVTLFELFSGRIAAEIERCEREQELQHLTKELEIKVQQRTQALSSAMDHLKISQQELINNEKMASLGQLVAGVAHEINSPLGVAILSGSLLDDLSKSMQMKLADKSLSKNDLEQGLATLLETISGMNFNLDRAAQLIDNFKQVAVDRSTDEVKKFIFATWLDTLMNSLMPMLKKQQITLVKELPEHDLSLITCSSKLAQVLTNLVFNAVIHGFPSQSGIIDKTITISLLEQADNIQLRVSDNGVGIKQENIAKLFEPFYTTKRNQGSTGLGLSIIRNILTESLRGNIELNDNYQNGCQFILTLPKTISTETVN